jgi:hypothetical protein
MAIDLRGLDTHQTVYSTNTKSCGDVVRMTQRRTALNDSACSGDDYSARIGHCSTDPFGQVLDVSGHMMGYRIEEEVFKLTAGPVPGQGMQVRHRAEEAPDPWNAIVQTRLLPEVV